MKFKTKCAHCQKELVIDSTADGTSSTVRLAESTDGRNMEERTVHHICPYCGKRFDVIVPRGQS